MTASSSIVREGISHTKQTWYCNRWMGLVAGLWIMSAAGLSFNFSIYSTSLKAALSYSQEQIDLVATASNIGNNVGLLAGVLSELIPEWALLLLGAAMNTVGYGALWLVASERISPLPFYQVFFYQWLAPTGATLLDTAALVVCVHNLPRSRGSVVGLLMGMIGLSGAIYAQFFEATTSPDAASFLLMAALGPTLTTLIATPLLRPISVEKESDESSKARETWNVNLCFGLCFGLAIYLSVYTTVAAFTRMGRITNLLVSIGAITFLLFPLVIPLKMTNLDLTPKVFQTFDKLDNFKKSKRAAERAESVSLEITATISAQNGNPHNEGSSTPSPSTSPKERSPSPERHPNGTLNPPSDQKKVIRGPAQVMTKEVQASPTAVVEVGPREVFEPSPLVDRSCMEALVSLEFWLLFASMLFGVGSTATVINNLDAVADAQGYGNTSVLVSLISISNFMGRVLGGFYSDYLLVTQCRPRSVVIAWSQAAMIGSYVLLAFPLSGAIYFSLFVIGFGLGATDSLVAAATSELFGLKSFGLIYNVVTSAPALGSYIFATLLAGYVYDKEAWVIRASEVEVCYGAHCFQATFLVMAAVSALGVIANMWLTERTQAFYEATHGRRIGLVHVVKEPMPEKEIEKMSV